jgi:hypothetical protein
MESTTLYYLLAGALIVIGLAGTVLPALPGLPLVFAGMLLAAWAGDFQTIGGWTVLLLGLLTAASIIGELMASALGAKRVGASRKAMLGAAIGTFAGLFLGIAGLLVGPFVGAVIGEMSDGREWRQASKVGFGAWLGLAVGAALKLALAFAMLGIFVLAIWFD